MARATRQPEASRAASGPEPKPATRRDERAGSGQRIGILGGTFDPPHIGHLWLATLAADGLGLDRVLFMPASQPPHKRGRQVSAAADRLLMTRLAIASDPLFELCPIEMERPGPSYTIDSVSQLRDLYVGSQLFLLMAADSLSQIDTWREPDRLLSLVEWVVGPRPGSPLPASATLRERFGADASRIHVLDGPSLDVSASEIRRRVAAGQAIRYLVPVAVEELIVRRNLYRRTTRR
jgi:nicotinate-nucleotide adenylyltransferase